MCTLKSFNFVSMQYFKDCEINDQNTYQFEFINLTTSKVIINNSIVLNAITDNFHSWKENIQENEKTETIYRIKFDPPLTDSKVGLLVIYKIPVKPRK